MGEGAISQSSPSKALRMFCQSRLFLLHKFVTPSPRLASPPSCLDKSAPPPRSRHRLTVAAVVMCWTAWTGCPSRLMPAAQAEPCNQRLCSGLFVLLVSATSQTKNSPDETQQTENPHLDLVFRKFISGLDKISFCHRSSFLFFPH